MAVFVPGQPAQLILDEEDVYEDPFKDKRHGLGPTEVPTMTYTEPGLSITTIEIPAAGSAKIYESLLQQLFTAQGVIVLRCLGQTVWDKDIYMGMNVLFAELLEAADSRPTFIINVCKGEIRSHMMAFVAMSDVCLADPESSFGFPEVRVGGLPAPNLSLLWLLDALTTSILTKKKKEMLMLEWELKWLGLTILDLLLSVHSLLLSLNSSELLLPPLSNKLKKPQEKTQL